MRAKGIARLLARPVASFAMACAVSVAGAQGMQTAALEQPGAVSTDTVDIEVVEAGEEGELVDDSALERTVSVENRGSQCWVRFRRLLSCGESPAVTETSHWEGRDGFAVGSDGYVYRTRPLLERETAEWSEPVSVPEELRDGSGADLVSELTVEAVQVRGLAVDFASDDPWCSVKPVECVHTREEL